MRIDPLGVVYLLSVRGRTVHLKLTWVHDGLRSRSNSNVFFQLGLTAESINTDILSI